MHKSFVLSLLIFKPKRCYWMTASLYRKYNVFSTGSHESAQTEQNHKTMTFVGLPDHVYFYLTMVIIQYWLIIHI